MKTDTDYMSELFRIISGALRLDANKVRNYTSFLADKFEANGEKTVAGRLRKLISENDNQLHPINLVNKALPVDGETRLSLVEKVYLDDPSESELILTSEQKDIFNEFISIAKSQVQFELEGINAPVSFLIYGPPGCGKSRLARQVARELGFNLFIAKLDGLISSYLGSTSKNIRAIFQFVSEQPCVLFLDEFDAIAKLRDDAQELGELKRVVNSFLQNLDNVGSQTIVIAATNHHQLLDAAVWRRFNYRLEIGYPTQELRSQMWLEFLKPHSLNEHDIEILTDLSEGFSGADIREICLRLRRQAIMSKDSPKLKDAFIGLQRLAIGEGEKRRFVASLKNNDEHEIAKKLKIRNPKLYSHASVASILQISKATAHRWVKQGSTNG